MTTPRRYNRPPGHHKYKLIRYFWNGQKKVLARGLTLQQAEDRVKVSLKKHLNDQTPEWFDDYVEDTPELEANSVFGPPVSLAENPLGGSVFLLAAGLGLIGWALLAKTPAPAPSAPPPPLPPAQPGCKPLLLVKGFAGEKQLHWFFTDTAVSTWKAPTTAGWTSDARVYSQSDCAFYGWNGAAWIKDMTLTEELAKA